MIERQPVRPARINPGESVKQTGRHVDGVLIGSQRNSAKRASRKRMHRLCGEQTRLDGVRMKSKISEGNTPKTPGNSPLVLYHVPTPKSVTRFPVEVENSIDFSVQYDTPTRFSQKKPSPGLRQNIPTITQDEDQESIKVTQERGRRLRRIAIGISTKSSVSISLQALYTHLGNVIFDTPEWSVPHKISNEELPTSP